MSEVSKLINSQVNSILTKQRGSFWDQFNSPIYWNEELSKEKNKFNKGRKNYDS